jgi:hypothetical protein
VHRRSVNGSHSLPARELSAPSPRTGFVAARATSPAGRPSTSCCGGPAAPAPSTCSTIPGRRWRSPGRSIADPSRERGTSWRSFASAPPSWRPTFGGAVSRC